MGKSVHGSEVCREYWERIPRLPAREEYAEKKIIITGIRKQE